MSPTDEELLHAYYAGDDVALDRLIQRLDPMLAGIAHLIMGNRAGSALQALFEWDNDERVALGRTKGFPR